jgi:hypothetical protein
MKNFPYILTISSEKGGVGKTKLATKATRTIRVTQINKITRTSKGTQIIRVSINAMNRLKKSSKTQKPHLKMQALKPSKKTSMT